jgi:hypothetical protein
MLVAAAATTREVWWRPQPQLQKEKKAAPAAGAIGLAATAAGTQTHLMPISTSTQKECSSSSGQYSRSRAIVVRFLRLRTPLLLSGFSYLTWQGQVSAQNSTVSLGQLCCEEHVFVMWDYM